MWNSNAPADAFRLYSSVCDHPPNGLLIYRESSGNIRDAKVLLASGTIARFFRVNTLFHEVHSLIE